jgi:DNA-binding CsgD family transcriptional regulator
MTALSHVLPSLPEGLAPVAGMPCHSGAGPEPDCFVGRREQLAVVERVLTKPGASPVSVLTVSGGPGLGKSAFLDRARQYATSLGWAARHLWAERRAEPPTASPGGHSCWKHLYDEIADRKVLLCIDDAQWLTQREIEGLAGLIHRHGVNRLVIALAHRPGRLDPKLVSALAAGDPANVHRVELKPFSLAETRALIGPHRTETEMRRLHEVGEGNPAYLLGEVSLRSDLDSLAPAHVTVAHTAAVLVGGFTIGDVESIAGLPHDLVAEGVDDLIREEVLRLSRATGRLEFRHPLVQQAVYDSAGVSWRRHAHARAAAMLRERGEAEQIWAEHVRQSATAGDLEAVRQLTKAAGAVRLSSAEAAARWYEAAYNLLPQNASTRARRGRLLLSRAESLTVAGHLIPGRDAAAAALDLVPQRGWRVRRQALLLTARIGQATGAFEEAAALLRRAGESCPEPDLVTASIRVELAGTQVMQGDFESARKTAETMLTAETPGSQWEQAAATGIVALAFYVSGDGPRATAYAEQMGRLIDASSDRELAPLLGSMVWLGWTDMFLGRYEQAQRRQARAAALARVSRQRHVLINLLVGQGGALRYLGRLTESRDCYEEAYEAARRSGSDVLLVATLAMLCRIHTWLGEHECALEYGEHAADLARRTSGWFTAIAPAVLAQAKLEAGDSAGCADALLNATGGPDLPRIELGSRPDWYELLTRASLMDGDLDEALGWAKRAREATGQLEVPGNAGFAWLASAQVALAEGDAQRAVADAQTAAGHFDACDNRTDALRARLVAGQALGAAGQRAQATELLQRASREAATYHAAGLQRRCAAALAAIAGRPTVTRVKPDALAQLTGREREVADLVAAGCTNREIAGKLFLSVKTIERHLARIFGKLEIASRAKLAAMIAGSG